MIANKKEFTLGAGLMVGFLVVLAIIFMPVFHGQNGLNYMDSLYNSISKGSAYYIPKMKEEITGAKGAAIQATLSFPDAAWTEKASVLFNQSGAMINISGNELKISGDLEAILAVCLEDSDAMYKNNGEALKTRYGHDAKEMLYAWWLSLKELDKDLKKQELFKEAKIIGQVETKAVETAFNYYGIQAQKISDKIGIVFFSLVFYVIYTLWYGYAIMFMAEGWGLELESH